MIYKIQKSAYITIRKYSSIYKKNKKNCKKHLTIYRYSGIL